MPRRSRMQAWHGTRLLAWRNTARKHCTTEEIIAGPSRSSSATPGPPAPGAPHAASSG